MKQFGVLFQWLFSIGCWIVAIQNVFLVLQGLGTYQDIIKLVGAVAFGCMLFPPFHNVIQKSQYNSQIRWGITILFVAWIVLPFMQLDSFSKNRRENEETLATFETVHVAAQKYCDDKGECAGSMNDLLNEGYISQQAAPKAGQRPPIDDPDYSRIRYYSTGNGTGCTLTLSLRSLFGEVENSVKYCSVK